MISYKSCWSLAFNPTGIQRLMQIKVSVHSVYLKYFRLNLSQFYWLSELSRERHWYIMCKHLCRALILPWTAFFETFINSQCINTFWKRFRKNSNSNKNKNMWLFSFLAKRSYLHYALQKYRQKETPSAPKVQGTVNKRVLRSLIIKTPNFFKALLCREKPSIKPNLPRLFLYVRHRLWRSCKQKSTVAGMRHSSFSIFVQGLNSVPV